MMSDCLPTWETGMLWEPVSFRVQFAGAAGFPFGSTVSCKVVLPHGDFLLTCTTIRKGTKKIALTLSRPSASETVEGTFSIAVESGIGRKTPVRFSQSSLIESNPWGAVKLNHLHKYTCESDVDLVQLCDENGKLVCRADMSICKSLGLGKQVAPYVPCAKSKRLDNVTLSVAVQTLDMLLKETGPPDAILQIIGSQGECLASIVAHRCILCSRSEVLRAMLQGNMTEAATGIVTLTDVTEKVMRAVVRYIYTDGLEHEILCECGLDVLAVAVKYQLSGLVDLCAAHLIDSLNPDNALTCLQAAHFLGIPEIKQEALTVIADNIGASLPTRGALVSGGLDLCAEIFEAITGCHLPPDLEEEAGEEKEELLGKASVVTEISSQQHVAAASMSSV